MVFATAEKALKPKSETAKIIAWVYAGILTVMTVVQLFAFEDFVPLFHDMAFPGGNGTGSLLACLIVFAEVFALPFLLRMQLSPLMRWMSLVCGWVVPVLWLAVSLWLFHVYPASVAATMNAGILGTDVSVANSLQIVIIAVLFALAGYATYGLWPAQKK